MSIFKPHTYFRYGLLTFIVAVPLCLSTLTASAQSGSTDPDFEGNAGAVIVNGLRVIKRQDLDFGIIAPSLTEIDKVRTNRGSNNDSVCGAKLTCFKPGNRARFTVIGDFGRLVTISNPGSIQIYNDAGDTMVVDTFTGAGSGNNTDWRGWAQLRQSGVSRFNVGATLHVNPMQPSGDYIGQFTLNFEYQ